MIQKIKIVLFFNNVRGLEIYKLLKRKKDISIIKVFLSKKNLNKKIINKVKNFKIINKLYTAEIKNTILKSDVVVVGGFPLIFKKKLIEMSKFGVINCHAGILPKYRGGSPLNWQIINNEKYFGITTIKMNSAIDGGDIIKEKKFLLKKNFNINDLHKIVNREFPKITYESILKILKKNKLKQQKKFNSYYPQRTSNYSLLKFEDMNLVQIKNFVRALQKPYPNPFFYYKSKKITFHKFQLSKNKLKKGEVIFKNNSFFLGCNDCVIKILHYK